MDTNSTIYLVLLFIFLVLLFNRKLMNLESWRATMTPLASIIGSGFLISAPLLAHVGTNLAPYLMLGLCLIAFALGEIIRWNIAKIEPALEEESLSRKVRFFEKSSDWSLSLAYMLSITYYLYIFSSFVLRGTGLGSQGLEQITATCVFWAIALIGHQNGLDSIEKIEGMAVNLKLAIIATFLVALAYFNYQQGSISLIPSGPQLEPHGIATLLGLLIMVQGFETSRYLGEKYSGELRIKSMRLAQLISMAIYFFFILLVMKVIDLHPIEGEISETSIIDISKHVFSTGPLMLLFAAMASQLSAAVADMAGSGGLIVELTHKKITSKNAYLIIAGVGTVLIWAFDIFQVISFASKAFALYYLCQSLVSLCYHFKKNHFKTLFSLAGVILCLLVIFVGRSFE